MELKTKSLEMFQKAVISENKRLKEKSKSSKIVNKVSSRRPKDFVVKSHLKTLPRSNSENGKSKFEAQPLKSRLSEKLRTLKSSKSKSSEVVGKRKALGVLQPSNVSRLTTSSPNNQLDQDLKRVLGRDLNSSETCKYDIGKLAEVRLLPATLPPTSPVSDRASSVTEMELTPKQFATEDPLQRIATTLAQSLQTEMYFPDSSYLTNVKTELRKVMKQSDPQGYDDLLNVLSARKEQESKHTDSDDNSDDNTDDDRNFTILPQQSSYLMSDNTDNLSSLTLLSDTSPPESHSSHFFSSPLTQTMTFIDNIEIAPSSAPLCVSTATVQHPPASMDFLDMMDSANNSSELTSNSEGVNPSRWLPTPDRPRMFPRKLY